MYCSMERSKRSIRNHLKEPCYDELWLGFFSVACDVFENNTCQLEGGESNVVVLDKPVLVCECVCCVTDNSSLIIYFTFPHNNLC